MSRSRVLVVEDQALTASMIRLNLEHEGFEVEVVGDGVSALDRLRASAWDLVVLDYMLPQVDGFTVLKQARAEGLGTPVLMVTARGETDRKVNAFALGADDYLTKPFDIDELVARCRALIRRSQAALEIPSARRFRIGRAQISLDERNARAEEESFTLGDKEVRLLALFAREPARVFSRADLIEEVWGMDAVPTPRTVDNFIVRLRRIVEPDPANPRHIVSVRGTGYRYDV